MTTEATQAATITPKTVETQSTTPAAKTNRVVAKRTGKTVVATAPAAKVTKPAKSVKAPKVAASHKTAVKAKVAIKPKAPIKPKVAKPVKEKKPKLVRDSFTIPKAEYTVLDDLKARANKLASPAKKSELLRAGIKALAAMSDAAFQVALRAVPAIKTGRPAKD
jgi:hypothetical protein